MTQTLTQKSMLARLLANENIEVVQGNYPTAFFDVEKRVLGLPFFNNDISKDLYDLLVGHEVGHALFTPADGWHDSETEVPNAPRALINIIEDIRIEKLILRKYPGLVAGFKRGYQDLLDRNFFGIDGENVNEMNLLDRLNLFSKSRGLVDVEFADEEKDLVKQAMSVESWDDVLKACSAIADFLGMEKPAEEETETQQIEIEVQTTGSDENEGEDEQESTSTSDMSDDEGEEEEQPSVGDGEESDEEESEEAPAQGTEASEETEDKEEEKSEQSTVGGDDAGRSTADNQIVSKTDEAFRENEKTLVDTVTSGGKTVYVKGMSRDMFNAVKVPYKKVEEHRLATSSYERVNFPQDKYDAWIKDAKAQVNLLVKEFEMRKAAYRTMRARTSNKGSLDVTKLHKYKYDDQLFKQVTHLADAKSHGMVMLVDYSGSMYRQIESVMRQTIIMSMFCKRVGVPFEVYGFTNCSGEQYQESMIIEKKENMHTKVITGDMQLVELLSSTMTKQVFEKQIKVLFNVWRHMYYGQNGYDNMRGTPLYEALMGVHYILEDFQKKHPVQKMNLIVLTDGAGDRVQTQNGIDMTHMPEADRLWFDPVRYAENTYLDFRGKQMKVNLKDRDYGRSAESLQVALLNNIKEEFGATVCHYFVADTPREYRWAVQMTGVEYNDLQKAVQESRKKGAFIVDNHLGYDRRFILEARGDVLKRRDAGDDALEVDGEMTAAQIASAFKKSSNGRSKQRFFSQKLTEMIA